MLIESAQRCKRRVRQVRKVCEGSGDIVQPSWQSREGSLQSQSRKASLPVRGTSSAILQARRRIDAASYG